MSDGIGIYQHASKPRWLLNTEHSSYAIGVNEHGLVLQLYWGPRLRSIDDVIEFGQAFERAAQDPDPSNTPEVYPAYGGLRYREFAAQATFSDGRK